MLSDISVKYTAKMQLYLYSSLLQVTKNSHRSIAIPCGIMVSLADIVIDTVKVPLASLENGVFFAVNICGHLSFESCTLEDGCQNLKKAGVGALLSMPTILLSLPKFIIQCYRTINNLQEAKSYNDKAAQEALFQSIVYPDRVTTAIPAEFSNN